METTAQRTDEAVGKPRGSWLFVVFLLAILLLMFALARWLSPPQAEIHFGNPAGWTPALQPQGDTVRLTVDFGNGATKDFAALRWREGMTVADAMQEASDFRPGLTFAQTGEGESGLLMAVDGLHNEGGGERNWLFRVDNRHPHQSFCLERVEPGSHILWTFTDEMYNDGEQ